MTDAVEVVKIEPFFAKEENLALMRKLSELLISSATDDAETPGAIKILIENVNCIMRCPEIFDKYCLVSIKDDGENFIHGINEFRVIPPESRQASIISLFCYTYRFILEREFCDKDFRGDNSTTIKGSKRFVDNNLQKFSEDIKRRIINIDYLMPAKIMNHLIHHPKMAILMGIDEKLDKIESNRAIVGSLAEKLEEQKAGFNFVGLVKAFENMKTIKQKEKLWAFVGLIVCGFLMVAPIITELGYLWQNKDNLVNVEKLVLYAAIPSITLEVILVYFFRVVLAQYRSIKAQLLQLELRAALCQFIEKYAEFAAKTTEAKAPISEKFESLIFSGILANEDQIPSTFDGVEQFAKLIDALKKKG